MDNYPLSISNFQFRTHERALLVVIALTFALGTSVLSWSNLRAADLAPRFHWPDETTNYFFASRVARGESLAVPESRNFDAGDIIHPRTMNIRADGALVPGSYLGLPLWYGMVGRVLGERAMLFVTPILAGLGLLAFASIVRRLIGSSAALIATVFLALHPSVWLFTATAFLPNVPFVALVLMGFAVMLRGAHPLQLPLITRGRDRKDSPPLAGGGRGGVLRWFVGSALIGLALTIRTHELVWVLALIVAIVVWNWRYDAHHAPNVTRHRTMAFIIHHSSFIILGFALPFIPVLILNAQLYGSPFTTGYALLQDGGAAPTEFAVSFLPGWLTALIAPFGWHPIEALTRFWRYMVVPYPWFVGLSVAGFVAVGLSPFRTKRRKVAGAIIGTVMLVVWLIFYYGSWTIADPLVRETNVLTISYVRYWLPIVVILAPWVAMGLLAIVGRMPTRWRAHTIALVLLGIALTSFTQVVTDPTEGLLRQRQALDEHRSRARAVIAATEPNAVIVSHRMDKVFFPERTVVHAPVDTVSPLPPQWRGSDSSREASAEWERGRSTETDAFLRNLQALASQSPVYWYAPSTVQLSGFALVPVSGMPFGELLYRIGT